MSTRPARSVALAPVDKKNNVGNAGVSPVNDAEKTEVVDVSTATKSHYLAVATSRTFPYVADWLRDKSNDMQTKTKSLEWDREMNLSPQVQKQHKSILEGRLASQKEREKMVHFLQEINTVRLHQRSTGAAWFVGFREAVDAYMSELRGMEDVLLQRLRLAEEWTVGGQRDVVVAELARLERQREQLNIRAKRELRRETTRREQTLHNIRMAMERLVGEVGDAVTWEVQQRLHGKIRNRITAMSTHGTMNKNMNMNTMISEDVCGSTGGGSSPAPPEDEQEILNEEQKIKMELREMRMRRMGNRKLEIEKETRNNERRKNKKRQEQQQQQDGGENIQVVESSPMQGKEVVDTGINENEKKEFEVSGMWNSFTTPSAAITATTPMDEEHKEKVNNNNNNNNNKKRDSNGCSGGKLSVFSQMPPSVVTTEKVPKDTSAPGSGGVSMWPQVSSPSSPSCVMQSHVKKPPPHGKNKTWIEASEKLKLPQLTIRQRIHEGRGGDSNSMGNNNVHNNNNNNNNNNEHGSRTSQESVPTVSHKHIESRARRGIYHRGTVVFRPPIVEPPNRVGRNPNGQHNSDHIASLLAALSEDTSLFADSCETMSAEVKKLREELRNHQKETSRLLEVNIGLEVQRAQLLVQRDAQEAKLKSVKVEKGSENRVRDLDKILLDEELSHTLKVMQEQKKTQLEEAEQVQKSIVEFRTKIQNYEQLLQCVREYWRRNAAALKRVKNASNRHSVQLSRGSSNVSSASSADDSLSFVETIHSGCTTPRPRRAEEKKEMSDTLIPPSLSATKIGAKNLTDEMWKEFQGIPALGLSQPEEVAEFIHSVFEELTVGPVRIGEEDI